MTKKPAVTLVHKAAIEIAIPAISSFARHFSSDYRLDIHTDGSVDQADASILLHAAHGSEARLVHPEDRASVLEKRLSCYPATRKLLDGVGYNAKLELPMAVDPPYFYFDSDIVWLRPVANLEPPPQDAPNAFSTESWSWYNGVAKDREWIRAKTPGRVNSGFYYLSEPFPFDRMESMLTRGLFDSTIRYSTDQEIMAYLYPHMRMYHPSDLKRSRRGVRYNLATEPAAALHFPGGMWREHLDQMPVLEDQAGRAPVTIRYESPVPLTKLELASMRLKVKASDSQLLGNLINRIRSWRRNHAGGRTHGP